MGPDIFNLLLSGWIFFIYSAICVISIIFTFSLQIYTRIEEKLNIYILSNPILTPLDRSIDWFNILLKRHNRRAGIIFTVLSLMDLKLAFDIVSKL